jgi:ATP-dependent helicase/DNAse subunit B
MIVGNQLNRKTVFAICATDGGMPKSKDKAKLTDAERHKRFVEMAREVGAADDARAFDSAFKKVTAKPPKRKKAAP